jgi:hypothetical protein
MPIIDPSHAGQANGRAAAKRRYPLPNEPASYRQSKHPHCLIQPPAAISRRYAHSSCAPGVAPVLVSAICAGVTASWAAQVPGIELAGRVLPERALWLATRGVMRDYRRLDPGQ